MVFKQLHVKLQKEEKLDNGATKMLEFEITLENKVSWWRHQRETFSALLALCEGKSPVTGEFPSQRSVTRSFDVFFDLLLNKRLSKQSIRQWFETPSHPLWRNSNDLKKTRYSYFTYASWLPKMTVSWVFVSNFVTLTTKGEVIDRFAWQKASNA